MGRSLVGAVLTFLVRQWLAEDCRSFPELTANPQQGIAQEELASLAEIERSHMGKIERGEHMPTLALILKIAIALKISAADLMVATESNLRAASKLRT